MADEVNRKKEFTTEEILSLLSQLLGDYKLKIKDEELEAACEQHSQLRDIVHTIEALRLASSTLSKGQLETQVPSLGYVVSNLKALQSNLNHLVWQVIQVAKGDFSQRVDFLGDFSLSFNAMCERLERQNFELTELAQFDGLTKLANRQYLDEYLENLFGSDVVAGLPFALMMVDVDFFKKINDNYGHDIGDVVLESVADYLRQVFRTTDFVARYGGEEFVAVLPKANLEQALVVARRVLTYFREHPIQINDALSLFITVSIGLSVREDGDTSWEQVVKRSDIALYQAKNKGRARVEYEVSKV